MIIIGKKIGMKSTYLNGRILPFTIIYIYKNILNSIIKKNGYYIIETYFYIYKKINKILSIRKSIKNLKKNMFFFPKNKNLDIISFPKRKGFMGVIKKHNFSSNRKTHGNSKAHNKPGSIGMCQDPGKVFKGKKMSGRKIKSKRKIKNMKILFINKKNMEISLLGSIPGKKFSNVYLEYDI
ncbi:50S ribosomal protein L3 [Candidatus Vidania fulgoroideorum]